MKKIAALLLVFCITAASAIVAFAHPDTKNEYIFIVRDDEAIEFGDDTPFTIGGYTYMPDYIIHDWLELGTDWQSAQKTLVISRNGITVEADEIRNMVRMPKGNLSVPLYRKNGLLMIPIEPVITALGFGGSYIPDGKIVRITTGAETLSDEEIYNKYIDRINKERDALSYYPISDVKAVFELVKPVYIPATIRYTTNKYSDYDLKYKTGTVEKGTKVICLSSKSDFSNKVQLPDGRTCCVPLASLNISTKNYTNPVDLTNYQKNVFVNAMNYKSDTDYLIWINIERQKLNVFMKENGLWTIQRSCSCASGTNANPTPAGVYKYYARQKSWDYDTYYVGPILIFNGNYAIHSVLMNYNGTIYDGTVGRPASHGCVRIMPNDLAWIDGYVPRGTTVVVK